MTGSRMVRKQMYILASQADILKERAATYNVSEGELVRQALDKYLSAPFTEDHCFDLSVWKKELEFISRRSTTTGTFQEESAREGRTWKREDLYEH